MPDLDTAGDPETRPTPSQRFRDRQDAGAALGRRLVRYAGRADAVVVGLAPGGVIVADVVARELRLPLLEWSVRALGVPGDERLAMGAVAGPGMVVLDPDVIGAHGVSDAAVDQAILAAREALGPCAQAHDLGLQRAAVRDRVAIVVGDGLASGATLHAAALSLRLLGAGLVVAAVPVGARTTCEEVGGTVDELICLVGSESFHAVEEAYDVLPRVTDEDVVRVLARRATESHADHAAQNESRPPS